jgi:DNA-binding SARP family transcriptional activator/tetratricopeptide (TPR) repeat protein
VGIWQGGRFLGPARAQARTVLAVLLLDADRVVPVDAVIDALWGGDPPPSARNAVQGYVSRLRRHLATVPDATLTTSVRGYRLAVDRRLVDLHRFRDLVVEARTSDPATASGLLRTALSLWRGPALVDAAGSWLPTVIGTALEDERLAALDDRAASDLQAGRHDEVVADLSAVVAGHPLRERSACLLMTALHRGGRRADALDLFHNTRLRLVEDLGIEPGEEFQRAHHEILGSTIAAAAPPLAATVPRQLPADTAAFAGRTAELAALHALLPVAGESPATMTTCVVSGTAGVGKTALAVHWAHEVDGRFPDGQLYVNLRGFDARLPPLSAGEALRGLLEALGVPADRIPTTVEAQTGLYRSLLAGRRMLTVLDNARDAEQVRPLLPGSPGCLVLVTSRNQLTTLVAAEGSHHLTLGLLGWDEARELLTRRLGPGRVAAEPHAVDQIIERAARLPLALAIVAARATINRRQPLAALARELSEAGLDPFDGGDPVSDVRAVFSWSYDALPAPAARLFRLLGSHPGPDVSAPAAASLAGVSLSQAQAMLTTLARTHLVIEPAAGRYTFHDLLRAYAAELAHTHDDATGRHAALHRVLDHYLHTAHRAHHLLSPHQDPIPLAPAMMGIVPERLTDHRQAMAWFTANRPVLLAAVRQAADAGLDTHAWQLACALMEFLDRQGHWQDQAETFRLALDAASRLADPAGQAHAHRGLGHAYRRLGRHHEAHEHLRQALDLYRDTGDPASQARTNVNLAGLLEQQGRSAEAMAHDQLALTLFQALGNLAGQARALNNIGWYHALHGDHAAAIAHCRQALDLHEKTGDRRGQANAWHSLGYVHHQRGRYPDAVTCYQHALDRYRDVGDRYHEADTFTHLGDTHHATGDEHTARVSWHRALAILDEIAHPDAARLHAKLHLTHAG